MKKIILILFWSALVITTAGAFAVQHGVKLPAPKPLPKSSAIKAPPRPGSVPKRPAPARPALNPTPTPPPLPPSNP